MNTNSMLNSPTLVFSDLDGTLLDHHSYSFAPARASLKRLSKLGIPVILNTSKTFAEVMLVRKAMSLDTPFIIENGAAIFIPLNSLVTQPSGAKLQDGFYVLSLASKRERWIKLVKQLANEFSGEFEAFSDMSCERIAELTGLSLQDAEHSAQRAYGEPVMWLGSQQRKREFIEQAKSLGASPLMGGRFLHICGDTNKGKALIYLSEEYQRQGHFDLVKTIALGDGENDIAMLEAADLAVRILSPANPLPTLSGRNEVFTSSLHGPAGWQEMIDQLLP
jgi:mannosyl-3-phosphoglycerate phosphatase